MCVIEEVIVLSWVNDGLFICHMSCQLSSLFFVFCQVGSYPVAFPKRFLTYVLPKKFLSCYLSIRFISCALSCLVLSICRYRTHS